jgi:ATP-dependent Clp protease ATP-binding subunit ClpA
MFERFTADARETVVGAQREARQLRHRWIGTEHLLLALLSRADSSTAAVLGRHGLTHDAVTESIASFLGADLDADALSTLGIDLDAVRDSVEASFGPGALDAPPPASGCRDRGPSGHLPFSPRAKKVLELALREAIALKQKTIADGHIALGLLREGDGLAIKVLHDRGVDPVELRRDLTTMLRS